MRTRIKICGITRIEDAELVADCGADAMGMIFYQKSPRYVDIEQARLICNVLKPFLTTVAVVVDPTDEFLDQLVSDVGVDRIQFHGSESQHVCEQSARPYYKVLRVNDQNDLIEQLQQYPRTGAFLLDTYVKGQPGGTGRSFDWSVIDKARINRPVILAGGLTPENVYDAVLSVQPYAVDVNSGVEIKPGIKDANKINEFIIAVHEADQALDNQQGQTRDTTQYNA